jgi:hypothetical protein
VVTGFGNVASEPKIASRISKTYGILDNGLQEEKCLFNNVVFSQITANLGIFMLVIR